MVKTTYKCDLCKEERCKDDLYGFPWESGALKKGNYRLQVSLESCGDRHLCRNCIRCIVETWQDVAPEVAEISGPMPPSSPA